MKLKSFLLTSAATVILSSAAIASDLPSKKSAPAFTSAFNWSGFYVGATAGFGSHSNDIGIDFDDSSYDGVFPAQGTLSTSGSGPLVGLTAGFNHQSGQMVFGLEADISLANINQRNVINTDDPSFISSELSTFGTARGRIGYAVDKVLIYGTAGLAWGDVAVEAYDDYEPAGFDDHSTRIGWVGGAGIEYALSDKASVKFEGLYYDLGEKTHDDAFDSGYATYRDVSTGVVARAGVNFRF